MLTSLEINDEQLDEALDVLERAMGKIYKKLKKIDKKRGFLKVMSK